MRRGPYDCFVQNTSTHVHPLPQPPPTDTGLQDCEAKAKGLRSQKDAPHLPDVWRSVIAKSRARGGLRP